MQKIDVCSLAQSATRNLVEIKMLSDKEKIVLKILLFMQEIDVRTLEHTVTRNWVGIKMLSDKEKNCIKDLAVNARN